MDPAGGWTAIELGPAGEEGYETAARGLAGDETEGDETEGDDGLGVCPPVMMTGSRVAGLTGTNGRLDWPLFRVPNGRSTRGLVPRAEVLFALVPVPVPTLVPTVASRDWDWGWVAL